MCKAVVGVACMMVGGACRELFSSPDFAESAKNWASFFIFGGAIKAVGVVSGALVQNILVSWGCPVSWVVKDSLTRRVVFVQICDNLLCLCSDDLQFIGKAMPF